MKFGMFSRIIMPRLLLIHCKRFRDMTFSFAPFVLKTAMEIRERPLQPTKLVTLHIYSAAPIKFTLIGTFFKKCTSLSFPRSRETGARPS